MQCPQCNAANRKDCRFCVECGVPLPVTCSVCDFPNQPDDKFCGGCGRALVNSAVEVATESKTLAETREPDRRQVTVMFCDLAGSTELAERLDPEDLRERIRSFQRICTEVIRRYEGFVGRYMGDGILAYFGYPQAHEEDAERAVRAGLGIMDALCDFNASQLSENLREFAVRIGIATGIVVAGDLIGEGTSEEQSVVGKTLNLAARLQSLAEPNSVIITSDTKQLLGGIFEYQDYSSHDLKGIAEPVHVWKVLGVKPTESRFEAVHGIELTPLVGREEELEFLYRRWKQAVTCDGRVVLISGEAGIGKSRIAQTLREYVETEPSVQFRYQCSPYHTNSTLYPFISELERTLNYGQEDTSQQKLDKLETVLKRFHNRSEFDIQLFAELLSIPTGGRYPSLDLSPQQLKERTISILVARLEEAAEHNTAFILFEDAHWIDPTSQELLDILIERILKHRVLLVIAFRPDYQPPWTGQPHVDTVTLNRLDHNESAALVQRAAGGKLLPKEVFDQIVAKTDGVPLFVEELTKAVLCSDLLTEQQDSYALNGPLPPLAIPASLHDSLMSRLDRLARVKEVAQVGAAIGREFSYELLSAVGNFPKSLLAGTLKELVDSQIIYQRGTPPLAMYTFKHALVQDAAYESLLKSRRRQMHARIALILEEQVSKQARVEPEIIAQHYTKAGLAEPAVTYWEQAGLRALKHSANREAVAHTTKSLEMLRQLPETDDRAARELDLQILLGTAYRATKGFASLETEQAFRQAHELSQRVGDDQRRIDVQRGLYACYYVRGELRRAREHAEKVISLGQTLDASYNMLGHWMLGCIQFWQGEFGDARRELKQAYSLYDPKEQSTKKLSAQIDPGLSALIHLGWTLWVAGYPEQAVRTSEQALTLANKLQQPHGLAQALFFACNTYICSGRVEEAESMSKELMDVASKHKLAYFGTCAVVVEGQNLLLRQQYEPGIARIFQGLSEFTEQTAGVGLPWALAMPIESYAFIGQPNEGLKWLSKARAAVDNNEERHWLAELERLNGELLLAQSVENADEVERSFYQAIEIARTQHAKSLELRAAMSLARLLQQKKQLSEARSCLSEVYEWFTEGLATKDLLEARALLDSLS